MPNDWFWPIAVFVNEVVAYMVHAAFLCDALGLIQRSARVASFWLLLTSVLDVILSSCCITHDVSPAVEHLYRYGVAVVGSVKYVSHF